MSRYSSVLKTCEELMKNNEPIFPSLAEKMRRLAAMREEQYQRCQKVLRYMDKTE